MSKIKKSELEKLVFEPITFEPYVGSHVRVCALCFGRQLENGLVEHKEYCTQVKAQRELLLISSNLVQSLTGLRDISKRIDSLKETIT